MSERETNSSSQRTSKMAIASLACSGLAAFFMLLAWLLYIVFGDSAIYLYCFCTAMWVIPVLAAPVLGFAGVISVLCSKGRLVGVKWAVLGILIWLGLIWLVVYSYEQFYVKGQKLACGSNLYGLGMAIRAYSEDNNGKYPTADKWCDLLVMYCEVGPRQFVCPSSDAKEGESSYAFNKNLIGKRPTEVPPDVVVLFETKGGWNQFGGPEILTTENHRGKGCNILFNDGSVEFVKPERIGELKWRVEEEEENGSGNFRKPGNEKELKYWLENMVWYHRFTNEEISAATGLTEKAIVAALKKFDIRPDNRPRRAKDTPLLVLPYPGGRHPRIGFLDGAIDPQRETKFSVFTPWDANSYVVVDVPEAIWSNLGLTYLAHTHIETIWTKQDIVLPRLEWNRHPDGTLDIERKLPNGIVFGVKVRPETRAVRMELWLKNGTDEKLSDLRVQNCVMTKMAAGFEQQSNDNKVFTNPYVACRSSDGRRWIITAWEGCHQPWGNEKCPCFHSDPKFPDAEPGETHRLRGWLSFYEGTDIEAEFNRIETTGWREK